MFTGSECLQVLKMFKGSECLQVLNVGSVRKITIENDQDLLLTASNEADTVTKKIL